MTDAPKVGDTVSVRFKITHIDPVSGWYYCADVRDDHPDHAGTPRGWFPYVSPAQVIAAPSGDAEALAERLEAGCIYSPEPMFDNEPGHDDAATARLRNEAAARLRAQDARIAALYDALWELVAAHAQADSTVKDKRVKAADKVARQTIADATPGVEHG